MKLRLDYSAHISVIVNMPDDLDEEMVERKAMETADAYLHGNGVHPDWELDDCGIEEVDDSYEADAYFEED